jgi:murein DD-endopeptidase MepM/ murein hydrolase activator NlpD
VRVNGDSFDAPVLAPCDGLVVHVENRQPDAAPNETGRNRARPFGNYVSIETPRGYVILAHLRQDSIDIHVGERVRTGDLLGRCGNSGTTRGSHLHVHAQNQASAAIAAADGVPIAFLDRLGGEPMLLEYGDTLG